MIAVEVDQNQIRINIPTEGMSAEAVHAFLNRLRMEAAARRSQLTDDTAWKLAEEVKSGWWEQNQSRFGANERK